MLNELATEFKSELNCIRDNMEKYITFLYQLKKKSLIIMVIKKKLHTNLNLLIVLDLCQIHYQSLLITCLEFLNIKNVYHV